MASPDIIVIGGITKDTNIIDGRRKESLGGGLLYISSALKQLGVSVGVVSKCKEDVFDQVKSRLTSEHIDLSGLSIDADAEIYFVNTYSRGLRSQEAAMSSFKICKDDIPDKYLGAKLAIVSPVLSEVDINVIPWIRENGLLTVVELQGFVRRLVNGKVALSALEGSFPLSHVDILKGDRDEFIYGFEFSESSLIKCMRDIAERGPWIICVTLGDEGSLLYRDSIERRFYKIFPLKFDSIDATGAGDIYLAGFVYNYLTSGDALLAARYASALASYSIRFEGPSITIDRHILDSLVTGVKWQDISEL